MLETICIKRPPALGDHSSDTATLLNSTKQNLHLKTTCCKRPLLLLPLAGLWIQVMLYMRVQYLSKNFPFCVGCFRVIVLVSSWSVSSYETLYDISFIVVNRITSRLKAVFLIQRENFTETRRVFLTQLCFLFSTWNVQRKPSNGSQALVPAWGAFVFLCLRIDRPDAYSFCPV